MLGHCPRKFFSIPFHLFISNRDRKHSQQLESSIHLLKTPDANGSSQPQSKDGIPTFGSSSCEKKQCWHEIVQQSSYSQHIKFVEKTDKETSKDIRLLAGRG